jgi:hypothetical protein
VKTLYETIVSQRDYATPSSMDLQGFISILGDAEIFNIQNVADYVHSGIQERWHIPGDFPNVAPPFPVFWMEYFDTRKSVNLRHGFLFQATQDDVFRWVLSVSWILISNGFLAAPLSQRFGINDDGSIARRSDGTPFLVTTYRYNKEDLELEHMFVAPLLAVSFMHCKNVNIVPHEPRVTGKRQPRNASHIRFHTLQIEPMKKIFREDGNSEETGLKHALHICRGHFKDFSKGKGLFGRYKEIYWWDNQVRGSGEHGAVLKDYSINEPQNVV